MKIVYQRGKRHSRERQFPILSLIRRWRKEPIKRLSEIICEIRKNNVTFNDLFTRITRNNHLNFLCV